ncbi:DEAD/DEAH box helicase [Croceiramulus getboli]|nr:DEAD/DEAH box helicase [Flavobacteriaceae bacterium YJPT1-3]
MNTFSDIGVRKDFVKGLKELGIVNPTPIQQEVIPVLLESTTDLVGLAQTGTGKTAAYGLPVLHQVNPAQAHVQALILAPTRELVQQIQKQLFRYTKYVEESIFAEGVYGGEKIDLQIKRLKRPTQIIVATPGRLIDLLDKKAVDLTHIKTVVLDEADEMLSMGFQKELNTILDYTNKGKRNTWLFSATMPDAIKQIINQYMRKDAAHIEVNKHAQVNENISHQYVVTSIPDKVNTLIRILERFDEERGIVFCRTKAGTQQLAKTLREEGFAVGALEGDMQQKERDKVMRAFKNESLNIMISTDVSARGIDVNDLAFIVHHQLPEQLEYYTHRSGRTARAGKSGISIALVIPSEIQRVREIEKALDIRMKEVVL